MTQESDYPAIRQYRAGVQDQQTPLMQKHAHGWAQDECGDNTIVCTVCVDDDLAPSRDLDDTGIFKAQKNVR